jgi:hypothetical protein
MATYDSSDDEMATRFEGIGSSSDVVEEGNSNSNTTFISLQPTAASAPAPEQAVEQQQHYACAVIRKN